MSLPCKRDHKSSTCMDAASFSDLSFFLRRYFRMAVTQCVRKPARQFEPCDTTAFPKDASNSFFHAPSHAMTSECRKRLDMEQRRRSTWDKSWRTYDIRSGGMPKNSIVSQKDARCNTAIASCCSVGRYGSCRTQPKGVKSTRRPGPVIAGRHSY